MIDFSAGGVFKTPPQIPFGPSVEICQDCRGALLVEKTRTKKAVTLSIGAFKVHETVLKCKICKKIYVSEKLQKLIPPLCNIGYDVLVYVGKSMFLQCRNEKEIREDLRHKNVFLSKKGISYLAKKFIVCLALAHRESSEKIKNLLSKGGGYILHLDATCEGDSPHLMTGLDEITEIVLENVKLSSEKAEKIIPLLRNIKKRYGDPLAVVHDMGKGITNAAEEVFPDIPDRICHYHFLADSGDDLFGKENAKIRGRLRKHGIQGKLRKRVRELNKIIDDNTGLVESLVNSLKEESIQNCQQLNLMPAAAAHTLALWALDGKKQGQGYGFPFDRPYLSFYQRLKTIYLKLKELNAVEWGNRRDNKPYVKILRDLWDTIDDSVLRRAAEQMKEKITVFDKLRSAMRIALPDGKRGLNDNGEETDIHTIEKGVKEFCKWLSDDEELSKKEDYKKMLAQIEKYWEKLFSDPIVVDTPHGKITIQPQRTNNIIEQLFREVKRGFRKKSGLKSLSKILKGMLADTPFIKNLENPEYMKIILDGKSCLEERFAEIDAKIVRRELFKMTNDSVKIPPQIKKLIKMPDLPNTLVAAFTG
jgi:hypothetical protein